MDLRQELTNAPHIRHDRNERNDKSVTFMTRTLMILGIWCVIGASSGVATITADLSRHLIAITTAFTGSNVLLFGMLDQPTGDVVVTVRGPIGTETVKRKNRVGPIWLNTEEMTFTNAPFYYAIASSRPIEALADPTVLRRHGVGIENLTLRVDPEMVKAGMDADAFRHGLIRNKQADGLYDADPGLIEFVGPSLFRSDLHFPANVQPGDYRVEVLHFKDGYVIGGQSSILSVSKVGVEADIFDLAHQQSALYGLVCIVLAIGAGWTASAAFRRA